ncbi:MAG: SIR2 family protein, partial [Burkholderiales bacterium]|nr:SIR2 family protein [Burkholderiales bacterium]
MMTVLEKLKRGDLVPYLGPGLWQDAKPAHPANALDLVGKLTEKTSVPFKIRKTLSAAAQYIENFKHRKTLSALMQSAFATPPSPLALHEWIASQSFPLIVDAWYDGAMQQALSAREDWGQVQGLSQAEHHGVWVRYYDASGKRCEPAEAGDWRTLLYSPLGSARPAANFVVSDSDYVEILTEIDIQTPIPEEVRNIRAGKSFLFLGCRFCNQLERIFARQIIKRSSDRHWAVIEGELSRNEQRFL